MAKPSKKQEIHVSANEMVATTNSEPEKAPEPIAPPVILAAPQAPPVLVIHPKFRVKAKKKVSLRGQMILLREGDILDSSGYGMAGIKKLIEGGADLEEVK